MSMRATILMAAWDGCGMADCAFGTPVDTDLKLLQIVQYVSNLGLHPLLSCVELPDRAVIPGPRRVPLVPGVVTAMATASA